MRTSSRAATASGSSFAASTSCSSATSRRSCKKGRPSGPVIPRRERPCAQSLGAVSLAGKQRCALAGVELRKLRESTAPKLLLQPLWRGVDRRSQAERECEHRLAAGREHAIELVEEREHVRVRNK